MKYILLEILALLSFGVFAAECPVLTGKYSCDSNEGTVVVNILTEGNKYTISGADGQFPVVIVADGINHVSTLPALEGEIVERSQFICNQDKLEAHWRKSWYHDGRADEKEIPAIDEILNQFYMLDDDGNLVELNSRQRLYVGQERQPVDLSRRNCSKVTK